MGMSSKSRAYPRVFVYLVLAVILLASMPALAQDNGVQQNGEGKYANLTADWWQWIYSLPATDVNGTNTNPLLDSTGAYAAAGQKHGSGPAGKYFFLAGNIGGDMVRNVTVPADKALFFPVINYEADNAVPANPDGSLVNKKVPELRTMAAAFVDATESKYARLDGKPLSDFRVKSPTFSYTLPKKSLYAYYAVHYDPVYDQPQFKGTIKPVVSDGYWVVIPPLSRGQHKIEFGGSSSGFALSLVYNVTVK
jgi:hypothetical protein